MMIFDEARLPERRARGTDRYFVLCRTLWQNHSSPCFHSNSKMIISLWLSESGAAMYSVYTWDIILWMHLDLSKSKDNAVFSKHQPIVFSPVTIGLRGLKESQGVPCEMSGHICPLLLSHC